MGELERRMRADYKRFDRINFILNVGGMASFVFMFCIAAYAQIWLTVAISFLGVCLCIHEHYKWKKSALEWKAMIESARVLEENRKRLDAEMLRLERAREFLAQCDKEKSDA